jgi:hypothetical protein
MPGSHCEIPAGSEYKQLFLLTFKALKDCGGIMPAEAECVA